MVPKAVDRMRREGGICSKRGQAIVWGSSLCRLSSRVSASHQQALLSTRPAQLELWPPPASHTSLPLPQMWPTHLRHHISETRVSTMCCDVMWGWGWWEVWRKRERRAASSCPPSTWPWMATPTRWSRSRRSVSFKFKVKYNYSFQSIQLDFFKHIVKELIWLSQIEKQDWWKNHGSKRC